mmetsp:Transcript_6959/g.13848  ORF Transcript_6959/g.13848 Transcript_6959/m.13848 type:complete len:92 (+) Transcript_6959:491-766(+)
MGTDTQSDAKTRYAAGTLFHQGMSGGISDIIGNLRFSPKAGRKKKQTKEKGRPGSTWILKIWRKAPTQQFSEYDTSDCVQMNSLMKRPLMI